MKAENIRLQLENQTKLLVEAEKTLEELIHLIKQLGVDMTQLELACSCFPDQGREDICICGAEIHNIMLRELIKRTV